MILWRCIVVPVLVVGGLRIEQLFQAWAIKDCGRSPVPEKYAGLPSCSVYKCYSKYENLCPVIVTPKTAT
jgi:hypothetical protein